jgi:hypothetical protein
VKGHNVFMKIRENERKCEKTEQHQNEIYLWGESVGKFLKNVD